MSQALQKQPAGFARFQLDKTLNDGIAAAGFTEPRPIQSQTIPAALEGRDVLGLAQTGTGKTAAFALPLLERLIRKPGKGVRALLLAPTRELATQIGAEIRSLGRFTRIEVATVFGGVPAQPQRLALKKGPEIVVACPGRLLDLLEQRALRLDGVETLVLDEADHMFDLGFLPSVRRILAALPARRQNLMFSATMPKAIRALADQILRTPHVVELSHSTPPSTIEHALYPTDDTGKLVLLESLLAGGGLQSAIVFTRTKHRAKRLARQLSVSGHRAVALQGNMTQSQRERAMAGFRKRQFDILVATDVAARGIDVEGVSHVVNFDMPNTADAYMHRVGRTGRAEREGKAYTFTTIDDHEIVRDIERRIGTPIPREAVAGISHPRASRASRAPRVSPAPRVASQVSPARRRAEPTKRGHRRTGRAPHTAQTTKAGSTKLYGFTGDDGRASCSSS